MTTTERRCCDFRCVRGLFFYYGPGARGDRARGLPPRLDPVEPTCPEGRHGVPRPVSEPAGDR